MRGRILANVQAINVMPSLVDGVEHSSFTIPKSHKIIDTHKQNWQEDWTKVWNFADSILDCCQRMHVQSCVVSIDTYFTVYSAVYCYPRWGSRTSMIFKRIRRYILNVDTFPNKPHANVFEKPHANGHAHIHHWGHRGPVFPWKSQIHLKSNGKFNVHMPPTIPIYG